MRVLFVVEAGFKAGLGHLLRSRALLLELRARGHAVDLWLRGDDAALAGRDWPAGMQVFHSRESEPIDAAYDGISRLLQRSHYDWLVIDGYGFYGHALYERFLAHDAKLLMLDDLADRELKADIVLNQNTAHAEVYSGGRVNASRFLLGPQYALIDRAYATSRAIPRTHGPLYCLLVTFGGVDRYGRTERVLKLLEDHQSQLNIIVVAGPYYPHLNKLKSWRSRHALTVVQNVADLACLLRECDFMISGGGTTVWQACCAGMPMLALKMVDNQSLVIKTLREFDAALCLDVSTSPEKNAGISELAFAEVFQQATEASVRESLSMKAMQLVDGDGAGRVADTMASCV